MFCPSCGSALPLEASLVGFTSASEDMHWADRELVEVLTGAGLTTGATPVILLLTARPEVLQGDATRSIEGDLHVPLGALPPDDRDELIARLATTLDLSPGDRAAKVARSGGNPLFAGELVRLLAQVREALDELVRLELIGQRRDSPLPGEEYAFRHALGAARLADLRATPDPAR